MTPLLLDINAPEFVLLLVIAVILFGPERLPDLARKAARLVRYLRMVAGNAQQQLSKELGPEFENVDFRDLNPKAFVQKHLLDDVEPVIADVKAEISDVGKTINNSSVEGDAINSKDHSAGPPNGVNGSSTSRALTPFDLEAT
ncbi:MAG TPA: sec-independent translocase [Propionibacteriaceae bacterium]